MNETKEKEDKKVVTFMSVRFFNGEKIQHAHRSYDDQWGDEVVFADLVLNDRNGNPVQKRGVDVTWGSILDFNQVRSLRLDPVVHANVIEAIRAFPLTKSSHKPAGARPMRGTWIVEYEPEVERDLKYSAFEIEETINVRLIALGKVVGSEIWRHVLVLMGVPIRGDLKQQRMDLSRLAKDKPEYFLGLLNEQEDGQLTINPKFVAEGLIKLAIEEGLITFTQGQYWFGETSLGRDSTRIHIDHLEELDKVRVEIDKKFPVTKSKSDAVIVEPRAPEKPDVPGGTLGDEDPE